MKRIIITGLISTMLFACSDEKKIENTPPQPETSISTEEIPPVETASEIFPSGDGWGYDIYVDGNKYIHQPHIPAISGERAFKSEEDAQKAANLVKYKIENGIMPPGISIEELDSLGVL